MHGEDVGKENFFLEENFDDTLNRTWVRKKIFHLKQKKTRTIANSLKPATIYIRIK